MLKPCPACQNPVSAEAVSCPRCGQPLHSPASRAISGNGSGTRSSAIIPSELRGFNLGAFMGTWVWAFGNSVWIGLLALIPALGLVMAFVLGFKGNEWAWQNRRWESVEQFQSVQRSWAIWGTVLGIIGLVLYIGIFVYMQTTSPPASAPY